MKEKTERQLLLVNAVAENFYKIVPKEFRTYCSLTSRISKSVLLHFDIEAELLPCQVWLATPEQNFVVGFTGKSAAPGKWNGHVVCEAGNFIIDTALCNFTRDFDLNVPYVAATPRFLVPTQVIARLDLNAQNSLWWHCPPSSSHEIDLNIPEEPPEIIAKYSTLLIEHISAMPVANRENMSLDHTQDAADSSLHKW